MRILSVYLNVATSTHVISELDGHSKSLGRGSDRIAVVVSFIDSSTPLDSGPCMAKLVQ